MPVFPSLKSPPSGITDQTTNAGTKARNGAMPVHPPVRPIGQEVLLEDQLHAVGEGLQDAERPGLVRPDPVLHAGDDLALEPDHEHRRQQADGEDHDDLQQHDDDGVHSRSPTRSGSMASTAYILSTRTSVTGDGEVDDLGDRRARHVERHAQRATRHALVRRHRNDDCAARCRRSAPPHRRRRRASRGRAGCMWAVLGVASGASDGEYAVPTARS